MISRVRLPPESSTRYSASLPRSSTWATSALLSGIQVMAPTLRFQSGVSAVRLLGGPLVQHDLLAVGLEARARASPGRPRSGRPASRSGLLSLAGLVVIGCRPLPSTPIRKTSLLVLVATTESGL